MASPAAPARKVNLQHKTQPELSLQRALGAGNWVQLIQECKALLLKDASHRWAYLLQGVALHKLGRMDDALSVFQQGLRYWPNDVEMQLNQAQILMDGGDAQSAVTILERVGQHYPNAFVVWLKLSVALLKLCNYVRGLACAQRCEALARTDIERSEALHFKAIHRRELGEVVSAISDCKAAVVLNPANVVARSNLLMFMLADPAVGPMDIRKASVEFAAVLESGKPVVQSDVPILERGAWDRLRIGFLSPDFRNHSVMYFVEGLLSQLDRRQFTVVGLQLNVRGDEVTQRVRNHCDEFIDLAANPVNARAAIIAAAKLDILVDLAGHTANTGLYLMAHRLAPVQVSWLGYPATTGMTCVDYKITDEVTDPEGADDQYTERLHRMATLFCCYRPHIRYPLRRYQQAYAVQPAPATVNGYVTFGSCNNLGKLTDDVLKLWGQLLHRLPTARLLIEGKNLEQDDFRADYQRRCEHFGIPAHRLELVPLDTRNQYLTYHRIDIALDPFPLTGGTTTFDLLWMGLPLVSMEGTCFRSRMSTGILTYLGRAGWLAQTPQAYLEIAVALASNVKELNQQRLAQRELVEQSPLMDEFAFSKQFGDGLRSMWLGWLAKRQYPDDAEAQAAWVAQVRLQSPPEWQEPMPMEVGMSPGKRVSLTDAHRQLELTLANVKAAALTEAAPPSSCDATSTWADLTQLIEAVLSSNPYDSVALRCVA
ncbi:MAG: tetratricopeptide repeat protein, partial [Burkholderiales bacterium]|nr:tetratricopeptide repeat protein [Burkholderiales bacterium]